MDPKLVLRVGFKPNSFKLGKKFGTLNTDENVDAKFPIDVLFGLQLK